MSTEILIRLRRLEDEVSYLKLMIQHNTQATHTLSLQLKSPVVKQLRDESYKGRISFRRLAAMLNLPPRELMKRIPQEIRATIKYSRTPDNDKLIRTVEFPEGWFK